MRRRVPHRNAPARRRARSPRWDRDLGRQGGVGLRLRLLGGARREEKAASEAEPTAALAVSGDLRVTGNASFPSGLVTHGDLTLEPDAQVEGDVRVGGTLTLGSGARVSGDAIVQGKVIAAADATVAGRLQCQKLLLRAGKAPVKQAIAEAEVVGTRPAAAKS